MWVAISNRVLKTKAANGQETCAKVFKILPSMRKYKSEVL